MRILILAAILLAPLAAHAQQQPPAVEALDALLHQAVEREANLAATAVQLQHQRDALQQQVTDLTKKLADATPKPQ